MYRSLYDVYLISIELSIKERQRISNIYSITLRPYRVKFNNVIRAI